MLILVSILSMFFPQPTPAERKEIHLAVVSLGFAKFAERERAAKRLLEFGLKARPQLAPAANGLYVDAETMHRAGSLIEKIIDREVGSLRPFPFIDSNWYCTTQRRYCLDESPFVVHKAILDQTPGNGQPWGRYRDATESWSRTQIRNGYPPALLRVRLAELHRRDAVWLGGRGESNLSVDWEAYLKAGSK